MSHYFVCEAGLDWAWPGDLAMVHHEAGSQMVAGLASFERSVHWDPTSEPRGSGVLQLALPGSLHGVSRMVAYGSPEGVPGETSRNVMAFCNLALRSPRLTSTSLLTRRVSWKPNHCPGRG